MYAWWLKRTKRGFKIFFRKIFFSKFSTQNFRKTSIYFCPFLVKYSINLVSLQCSIGVGMHVMAQNDHNTILLKWVKKSFKISPPKKFKNSIFWAQKWSKIGLYCGHFAQLYASLGQMIGPCAAMRDFGFKIRFGPF